HCVVVVFADEYYRKFPGHGHVEHLVQDTLTGSSVTKEGEANIIRSFVFFCKGNSGSGTNLRTYNSVSSEEIHLFSKEVHATALSFGATSSFSIKLGHTALGRNAFSQCQTVVAVSGNERILLPGGCHTTGSNGFLTYVGMEEATDFTFHFILFFCCKLKYPDELHQLIPV